MTSQTETARKRAAVAALAVAAGVRLTEAEAVATRGLWDAALAPYSAAEADAAVQACIRQTESFYGRMPAPGEIVARIEAARGMAALQRFKAQLAARRALDGRLSSARLAAEERHNRRMAALPASMPRAEWDRARAASMERLRSDLAAIDAEGAEGLAALEAESSAPALEVSHG